MNIHLVLVRTENGANIGAAARAMANMGGDRLILIQPQCPVDSKARQLAAGAQDTLQALVVYPSWDSFFAVEGEGFRLALTRRGGRNRKVFPLEEKLAELSSTLKAARCSGENATANLYLILGPEADGLDAQDLGLANFACHLPIYGEFGSLNLAQAALLSLYITRSYFKPAQMPEQLKGEIIPSVQPLYFPDQLIKNWLTAMGFNVQARRASAYLTLRRLFLQNLPTRHEIQVLEAILQQNIRKLRGEASPSNLLGLTTEELADDVGEIPV